MHSPPPQAREQYQLADLDELVREVAARAEQDDGLRRLLGASLRMCGQGAQSRLCLPGFALEAVRGAVRSAVERRPGGTPDAADAASRLLRQTVCQGDVAGCCLTPGIYCSTMTHEPLLRLLGEDTSAPNVRLPVAGSGLCGPCGELWHGAGTARTCARTCARARLRTELRNAELRLEAVAVPDRRAMTRIGGRAEMAMVAAKLAGLRQRLQQQRLQLLLRPRVPNTQIGETTGRKVLVVDPEPTPKTGWRLVMEVNSPS